MSTIRERFLKTQEEEREREIREQQEYARKLGERLNAALLDPEFIERATKILEKVGAVGFNDVGCLCQGGDCSRQKGFTEYIKEAEKFWGEQGVEIRFSIMSGLCVSGGGAIRGMYNSDYFYNINLYNKEDK